MSIITISVPAQLKIQELVCKKGAAAFSVSVKSGGCSGLVYKFELVDEIPTGWSHILCGVVPVIIDPVSELYILGSELDWTEENFQAKFVFNNPNATSKCGCNKSFGV